MRCSAKGSRTYGMPPWLNLNPSASRATLHGGSRVAKCGQQGIAGGSAQVKVYQKKGWSNSITLSGAGAQQHSHSGPKSLCIPIVCLPTPSR